MYEWLWDGSISRGLLENFEEHNRESLNYYEQTVGRNLDFENTALKGSEVRRMLLETGGRGILLCAGRNINEICETL